MSLFGAFSWKMHAKFSISLDNRFRREIGHCSLDLFHPAASYTEAVR